MNRDELRGRLDDVTRRMTDLDREIGDSPMTPAQSERWQTLEDESRSLRTQIEAGDRLERVEDSRRSWRATTVDGRTRGDASRTAGMSMEFSATRSAALRNVDALARSGRIGTPVGDRLNAMVDEGSDEQRELSALYIATTGAPEYASAFRALLRDPIRGHLMWTPEETEAYRAVERARRRWEGRAALALAGYVLPTSLDPAVMIYNAGAMTPLRSQARVVQTMTSSWKGIKTAGATAEWKTEGAEAADGTPAGTEVDIPVFASDVDATFSYEVAQDALDLENQLERVCRDAVEVLWETAYTTGGGTTDPQGIVTGLIGGASEINTTGSEAIDKTDPATLQNALGARYSAGASWQSNIAIKNAYAVIENTAGQWYFPELRNTPPSLLGKPWYENSIMDGAINAAATANNYVLIYADLPRCFVIVDRPGTTAEILPGYSGANGRPTGQRHLFLFARTGSEVVDIAAGRILDVPTTA